MKKFIPFYNVLRDYDIATNIQIYMSTSVAGDDYDSFGNNYTLSNLNPITVRGYVRELSPETAFWKQYGMYQAGMVEIICPDTFEQHFKLASRIVINNIDYQVFKEGTGNKVMVTRRPGQLLRVVLSRAS